MILPGTLPAPRTWTDGTFVTGAMLNHEIRDPFAWLLSTPAIKVSRKTDQVVANSTHPDIIWEFDDHKNDIIHSTNTDENPSRLIINTPGLYLACCRVEFSAQATAAGRRDLEIAVNDTTIAAETNYQPVNATPMRFSVTTMWKMATGNYFTARVAQTSGISLNLTGTECEFAVKLVAK